MTSVPYLAPNQSTIDLPRVANPYLSLWSSTHTISNIPDEAVGWLVAQGWQITAMSYDGTTVPPTPRYAMSKEAMQSWEVLLSLCNSYTIAANEARDANELRYNEIVLNWNALVDSTHLYFDSQDSQHSGDSDSYLAVISNCFNDVNTLIEANQTQVISDAELATAPLTEMNTKLAELETNADANTTTISAILTAQSGYLTSFLSDFSFTLDELDTHYAAHLSQIETLLTASDVDYAAHLADTETLLTASDEDYAAHLADTETLLTTAGIDLEDHATPYTANISSLDQDYSAHSITAPSYLTDLGATELARINEQFAATLSGQLQDLTDRGLYSAAVATDITARNARDKDEQIAALNDRLNREKLDNQHRLYEQQTGMRARVMDGRDRLYQTRQGVTQWQAGQQERLHQTQQGVTQWQAGQWDHLLEQIQQVETQKLAGIDRQYTAQQEVSRTEMSERDVLFAQLQDAVRAVADGKERYSNTLLQQASTVAEHKHRAIAEKLQEYAVNLEGLKYIAEQTIRLMQYQLEERNKLIIGLYSFVERREDESPEWKDISQLIAGLGDSGGGWITP